MQDCLSSNPLHTLLLQRHQPDGKWILQVNGMNQAFWVTAYTSVFMLSEILGAQLVQLFVLFFFCSCSVTGLMSAQAGATLRKQTYASGCLSFIYDGVRLRMWFPLVCQHHDWHIHKICTTWWIWACAYAYSCRHRNSCLKSRFSRGFEEGGSCDYIIKAAALFLFLLTWFRCRSLTTTLSLGESTKTDRGSDKHELILFIQIADYC